MLLKGVLFLNVAITGTGSPGSPGSPSLVACLRVVAVCCKGVSWQGLCGRLRIYF
jgi:hypothetical protein